MVGMVKQILRRVLGKACLSFEEMITVLCDCESLLNSRPLTYVSNDPNDLQTLSPSMFLNEIKTNETPDLDMIAEVDLNARYKHRQAVMQHLRNRFRKEYLSQLILKPGKKETRVLKEGDIVLIEDESGKRINWPLARIEKLILGRDNTPRVAILKTKKGTSKRPVQRIYPLEISSVQGNFDEEFREKLKIVKPVRIVKSKKCIADKKSKNDESETEIITRSGRIVKKPDRL